MRIKYKLLLLYISFSPLFTIGQDSYIVSGKIQDSLNSLGLSGASIKIKGALGGTVAKQDGSFQLKTSLKPP